MRRGRVLSEQEAEQKSKPFYWWLLLVIFFEYARPASYFPPLGILPLNSALPLGLMLATFFAPGMRPVQDIFKDRMAIWPLLYLLFIFVSLFYATITTRAYTVFTLVLGYVFIFWMIVRIVTTEARLRGMFIVLIFSHLFLLAMNPAVVLDPSNRNYIAGASFLGDGNDFSLSLCLLAPLAVLLALHTKNNMARLLLWGVMGMVLLAIIGTQSRGATLGIAAVFGYLWLQSNRKGLGLFAIIMALLIVLAYAPPVYFQRLGTITSYQTESSAEGRIQAWKAGARMAGDNVLGVGAGNFPNNFPRYRSDDAPVRWMTAHSMYFLILGELGILGLLLLLKLLLGNMWENMRLRRWLVRSAPGSKTTDPVTSPKVVRPAARRGRREEARDEDTPAQQLQHSVTILRFMNGSVIGFCVAGAFLSVAYYPHIFVLTGLMISARCIVAQRHGLDLGVLKGTAAKGRSRRPGRVLPPLPGAEGQGPTT